MKKNFTDGYVCRVMVLNEWEEFYIGEFIAIAAAFGLPTFRK